MSRYRTNSVTDATELVKYATIIGRLIPASSGDYMKLVRLARDFRRAVVYATRMIAKGVNANEILRELRGMLNKAYGDSAYKLAKALVEGCRFNGGDPKHIKVRKLFIISGGEASRLGNRNVRLEFTNTVKNQVPL